MEQEHETKPVEIKDLNKTQLILLALLLSFVTSIATGIVTVTLMEQAPTGVTQTINRVVQQTIEKVVPDYRPGKTQTVVVKEDDLVVDAVTKTRANLVGLYTMEDDGFRGSAYSLGGGVFVTSAGNIEPGFTQVIKKDTLVFDVKKTSISSELGIAILWASTAAGDEKNLLKVDIGKDSDTKPGQTLVVADMDSVQKGTVQSVTEESTKNASGTETTWNAIKLSLPMHQLPFGPAMNLDGSLAGFVTSNQKGAQIVAFDAIMKFIETPAPEPLSGV